MIHKKYQFSSFIYFAGGPEKSGGEAPEKSKEVPQEKPEQDVSPEGENEKTKYEAAKLVEGADKTARSFEEESQEEGDVTLEATLQIPKGSDEATTDGTESSSEYSGELKLVYAPTPGKLGLEYTVGGRFGYSEGTTTSMTRSLALDDRDKTSVSLGVGTRLLLPVSSTFGFYGGVDVAAGGARERTTLIYVDSGKGIQDSLKTLPVLEGKVSAGARAQLGSLRLGLEGHYSTTTKTGVSAVAGWTF